MKQKAFIYFVVDSVNYDDEMIMNESTASSSSLWKMNIFEEKNKDCPSHVRIKQLIFILLCINQCCPNSFSNNSDVPNNEKDILQKKGFAFLIFKTF